MKVAFVLGDNLIEEMRDVRQKGLPPHLDSDNRDVTVAENTLDLLEKNDKPVVSANAYLGAREILKGLEHGADIIIAGRVADASPVSGHANGKRLITTDHYRSLARRGTGMTGRTQTTMSLLARLLPATLSSAVDM